MRIFLVFFCTLLSVNGWSQTLPSGSWVFDAGDARWEGSISAADELLFHSGWSEVGGNRVPSKLLLVDRAEGRVAEEIDVETQDTLHTALFRSLDYFDTDVSGNWGAIEAVYQPLEEAPRGEPVPVLYRFSLKHRESNYLKPVAEGYATLDGGSSLVRPAFGGQALMVSFHADTSVYLFVDTPVLAQFFNEVGFEFYSKKNYSKALDHFANALAVLPTHATALYNAACASALLGDASGAVGFLNRLRALGTAAKKHLAKVARDPDFDGIRQDARFQKEAPWN